MPGGSFSFFRWSLGKYLVGRARPLVGLIAASVEGRTNKVCCRSAGRPSGAQGICLAVFPGLRCASSWAIFASPSGGNGAGPCFGPWSRPWFLCRAGDAEAHEKKAESFAQRVEHAHCSPSFQTHLAPSGVLVAGAGVGGVAWGRRKSRAAGGSGLSALARSRLTCHIWVSVSTCL